MKFLKKHFAIMIIISLSILVIGLTIYTYWKNDFLNPNYLLGTDKLGDFGSFIGGFLGTLITLLATVYVYKTYRSQKKELKKQKKQLKLQSQLIAQQQFESTFFNMLNVHRELKNNLTFQEISIFDDNTKIGELYKGLNTINFINKSFTTNYKNLKNKNQNLPGTVQNFKLDQLELELSKCNEINKNSILKVCFNDIFKTHQNQISHYCRNVYHILKYIRENEKNETLSKDTKKYKNYANIFQSQLNVDEQFLLFYNFIHFNKETKDEMYWTINLVNHYKFLENIGIENLILKKHELFYDFIIKGSDRTIEKK